MSQSGPSENSKKRRGNRGFRHAAALVGAQFKETGQTRGFLETRLLTHWKEVVGPDTAAICEPVEVSHKSGFGATLVLLSNGANAPIVEMQKDAIRDRVNAVYGYSAISKIRITQTSRYGFGEAPSPFVAAPKKRTTDQTDTQAFERASRSVSAIENETLRDALARLGTKVLASQETKKGQSK